MAFSHWEILIMWLFLFPLTLHWTQKEMSRFIVYVAYDYSCADWDSLHDHLRYAIWEDIFELSRSAPGGECCE